MRSEEGNAEERERDSRHNFLKQRGTLFPRQLNRGRRSRGRSREKLHSLARRVNFGRWSAARETRNNVVAQLRH